MVKRNVISILLILGIFLLPFAGITGFLFGAPTVYHNSFLAGLSVKHQRLYSIEEPKIVVVGGSSVAFGLDSQALEHAVGRPVVNYGLYASLGSKVMLDLSQDAIGPDDIVVLSFELDNQTLSTYFNAESMWQAVDCDSRLLWDVAAEDYEAMLGASFKHAKDKLRFLLGTAPDPEGVYNAKSFNEYGDIVYARPNNVMPTGFDPNQMIRFGDIVVESAFADYVNRYIEDVQSKGAQVCFSFCPLNAQAVTDNSDADKEAFVTMLKESFHCPVIGDIDHSILEAKHFYDTNFHLNDYGAYLRTKQLAKDLSRHYNLPYNEPTPPQTDSSADTDTPADTPDIQDSAFADCFLYEDFYGSGWAINGVSEKGKASNELEIPAYYQGKPVLAVLPEAFADCPMLETLRVTRRDTESLTVYDGAFAKCEALRTVLLDAKPASIKVGTEGLLNDASADLLFYVQKEHYAAYLTDYFWAIYADRLKVVN